MTPSRFSRRLVFPSLALSALLGSGGCGATGPPLDGSPPPPSATVMDLFPAASPDGSRIAYFHRDVGRPIESGLYVIDTDGTNKIRIYASKGFGIGGMDWSATGDWIVFAEFDQIFRIKSTGDSLTQLTTAGRNVFPSWSRAGSRIAFASTRADAAGLFHVWTMGFDGGSAARATPPAAGVTLGPGWLPGDTTVVLIGSFGTSVRADLGLLDLGSGSLVRLTDDPAVKASPSVSPDGSTLVYVVLPARAPPEIHRFELATAADSLLTQDGDFPCWTPDDRILFTETRGGTLSIWAMDPFGANKVPITE